MKRFTYIIIPRNKISNEDSNICSTYGLMRNNLAYITTFGKSTLAFGWHMSFYFPDRFC